MKLTKNKCQKCYRKELYLFKKDTNSSIIKKNSEMKSIKDENKRTAQFLATTIAGSIPEFFKLVTSPKKSPSSCSQFNPPTLTQKKRELRFQNQKSREILSKNAGHVYNSEISSFRAFDRSYFSNVFSTRSEINFLPRTSR